MYRDDRGKNANALLELEITPVKRKEVLKELAVKDYSEGPLEDKLYNTPGLWVFGKTVKNKEVYIKISIGHLKQPVILVSFHVAEHPMNYPFQHLKN